MKIYFAFDLWVILVPQFGINQALFVLKWNKDPEEFEPIMSIPSWVDDKQRRALNTRKEETHNFNGEELRLTHFQDPGFVNFIENDTKVTGIIGDIWVTLSKLLNFTLIVTRSNKPKAGPLLANGSFDGTLELARLNQTDIIPKMAASPERFQAVQFTIGVWVNKYTIFTHVDSKKNRGWMLKLLSIEVWCFVCVYILALSLARAVTERVKLRKQDGQNQRRSCSVHLFNTFRMFCNQGDIVNPIRESKILMVTISFYSYLILTAFSSRLISGLQREIIPQPDISFENLHEYTNIQTAVLKNSICYSLFSKNQTGATNEARPYIVAPDYNDLYNKVCLHSDKHILCDGTDEITMRRAQFCSLIHSEQSVDFHIIAGVSKRVKNKRSLDIGIMKLREFGIIEGLRTYYLSRIQTKEEVRNVASMAIDIPQVSMIMAIFGFGIATSIIICIAENIFFALKKRQPNKHLVHRYLGPNKVNLRSIVAVYLHKRKTMSRFRSASVSEINV